MRPSRFLGSHPRVGVEIEISRWKDQTENIGSAVWHQIRNQHAQRLIDLGLMAADADNHSYSTEYHNWNCVCTTCSQWENADADPYPVQFALKYDGTLPITGGEFISSPFTITKMNFDSFFQGWNALTEDAVCDRRIRNKQGAPSSPSVHVHASSENEDFDLKIAQDFAHMFMRELIVLAGATSIEPRGLNFRKPIAPNSGDHHGFMNLSPMRMLNEHGSLVIENGLYKMRGGRIELRVWEADYKEPRYIEGAIHVTAALAQVMNSALVSRKLMGLRMLRGREPEPFTYRRFDEVVADVNWDSYHMLQHALTTVTYAAFDNVARDAINWIFQQAEKNWRTNVI